MMITRKTRLTSGLVAVFMLVTMLAAFVFPASAADFQYPGVSEMVDLGRDATKDWGINTPEDWHAAVAIGKTGETFSGLTLHLSTDIDFDVDGSGEVEEDEYVGVLGNEEAGFAGNIHGHGHVMKNLYIKHDISVDGIYVGLVGWGSKKGIVIRDLGIESGKIQATGKTGADYADEKHNLYIGAFIGFNNNAMTIANCWNGAEVYSDAHIYETDLAPFGRLAACTIVNCYNTGLLKAESTGETYRDGATYQGGTVRVVPFYDWGTASCIVKNSFNVGELVAAGSTTYKSYVFTYGSGLDTPEEYQTIADVTKNVYTVGATDFSNRSVDSYVTLKDYQTTMNAYTSGALAGLLNTQYDDTYDKEYGHVYYKVENGKTVFAKDEYDATYSLTVIKKMGSYELGREIFYYTATDTIKIPAFKNYVLSDYSWEILPNFQTNTFPMPPANVEMTFSSAEPDWDLVADLVAKYGAYVESGHVKTMLKEAEVYELESKLQALYGMKDTLDKDLAIQMICRYAEEDVNFDLSVKPNLTYPNLPLLRFYASGSKGDWLIRDDADWRAAVALSDAGQSFSGVTFHFEKDIDFKNVPVDALGTGTAFKGNIHGHGYKIENLKIEHNVAERGVYVGLIGRASSGVVIRDLNLASGTVTVINNTKSVSAEKQDGKESYSGVFMGQGAGVTFANCWNNVDLYIEGVNSKWTDGKEAELALSGSIFGRKASGRMINCINTGKIFNNDKNKTGTNDSGGRASVFAEWHNGDLEDGDIVYLSNVYSTGGHKSGPSYGSGLVAFSKSATAKGQVDYFKNAYSVGFNFEASALASTVLNTPERVLQDGDEASGKLAWLMNANYDTTYDAEFGRKYYTVKNGQTVFGTVMEQPVKITIKNEGNVVEEFYGVPEGGIQLGSYYTNCQVVESYAASVDANNVLNIESIPDGMALTINVDFSAGLDYAELLTLIKEYEEAENKDGFKSHLTSDPLELTLKTLKNKNYASQSEIDEAVSLLKSYSDGMSIMDFDPDNMVGAYLVSNVKELEYLTTIKTQLTADQTIYITTNLDLSGWNKNTYPDIDGDIGNLDGLAASLSGSLAPGGKAKITGLTVASNLATYHTGWLGEYTGKLVEDLEFYQCSIAYSVNTYTGILMGTYAGTALTVRNVSMVECHFDQGATGSSNGARGGGLIGRITSGNVDFDNILLSGNTVENIGRQNIGTLYGFNSSGSIKVTAKNVYSVNNTYIYTHNANLYNMSPLIAEMNGELTLENVGVFNNTELGISGVTRTKNTALLCGYTKDTKKITAKNVLAFGNNLKNLYSVGSGASATLPKHTNVYAVCVNSDTALETITSGEALYAINATNPDKTWAFIDGVPVFSTTGLPHKVTFDYAYGEDVNLYTDCDGKLNGLTSAITSAKWDGYDDLANAVFTADTVIKQPVCAHEFTYTPDGTGKHVIRCTKDCGYQETVSCSNIYLVGNGTTHVKKCTICGGEVPEACNKVMTHINGTSGADAKHSEVCTVCGYTSAETACTFAEKKVEHTDQMNGYTQYTCGCGYSYTEIDGEKVHDWAAEGTELVKATYGKEGLVAYKCNHCEAVDYRTTPALMTTEAGIVLSAPRSDLQGGTFEVDVLLAQNPGVTGINMMVEFDPQVLALAQDGVKDHGVFGNYQVKTAEGKVRLTYLHGGANLTNAETDGKALTTLTFKVLDDAAIGLTSITATLVKDPADPTYTGAVNFDNECVNVLDATVLVEIVENLWGDADQDGVITPSDAQVIMQWKVGLAVAIDLKAADADRNGVVEIADALMILQHMNGNVGWDPNGTTKAPATV